MKRGKIPELVTSGGRRNSLEQRMRWEGEAQPGSPDPENGCSEVVQQPRMLSQGDHTGEEPSSEPCFGGRNEAQLGGCCWPCFDDVAFGRNMALRARMLLLYTTNCGFCRERRGKGGYSGGSWQ